MRSVTVRSNSTSSRLQLRGSGSHEGATPFLVLPMILAGTAPGIAAGYLIPAAGSLLVGLAVVRRHPDRSWRQTAMSGVR